MFVRFEKTEESDAFVRYKYTRHINYDGIISYDKVKNKIELEKPCGDYDSEYKNSADHTIEVFRKKVVMAGFPESKIYATG